MAESVDQEIQELKDSVVKAMRVPPEFLKMGTMSGMLRHVEDWERAMRRECRLVIEAEVKRRLRQ